MTPASACTSTPTCSDAALTSTLGPLKLSLGDPSDGGEKATAQAKYSIDLADGSASGTPVSFSDFMDDVGAELNASSDPAHCGLDGEGDLLALCANFPLYISTDGGSTYDKVITDPAKSNAFAIRLPKSTTPTSDYFDLTGAQIGGHDRLETPDPADLADAILANIIDFGQMNGLDDYLRLIETALNEASFGGKIPLIGDDLQQGADFVGNLRTAINDALADLPGDGNLGDTQGIRDWVNDSLDSALSDAGVNPDLVTVDTRCMSTLLPPGAPTVTPQGTDDGETYTYKIESYQLNADGDPEYSLLSDAGTTTAGGSDITTYPNLVEWTAADGAVGYRIFRLVGSDYKMVGETTETSFTDDNASPSGDPDNTSGTNPQLVDCDYTDLDSVRIVLDVHQGDFSGGTLSCPVSDPCISDSVPLDIGVPGLSLEGKDGEGPGYELGYRLHFEFGLSKSKGFFIDTNGAADDETEPELALGLNFTLPDAITAQLGFITITAENCLDTVDGCTSAPSTAAPLFDGVFSIDLVKPGDPNGLLTAADLSDASFDSLFDVKLSAGLHLNWLLKARPGDDVGFPGVQAQFIMDWAWSNDDPNDGATLPTVEFTNVAIDAGAVFGEVLGPIVNEIKKVTSPLDPVIKTLYAPIPVLSDLSHLAGGDDVTIVSIAKAFSTVAGGPKLDFVDTIAGVVDFINNLPECTATCLIPLGSFDLDPTKVVDNTATPDNTESMIEAGSKVDGDGGTSFASIAGKLDAKDSKSTGSLSGSDSPSAKAGFSFPVFDNPASLFNLLLGGDVDLVKFDSGPLRLGFDWRQSFGPVYAPPPVFVTLHGSASVTLRLVAGFDTYGIRKAVERANNDETFDIASVGDVILQSLFFYTTEDGKPIPVVSFNGEIAAGAEVSAVIIKVGIEGGVGLTVSFLWNDPNADGKFRISEFLQAALNNPICLFTVSGRIYVFLKAYVTLGFSPFDVTFDFTIVDVTLLDFDAAPDCDPPPPELGGLTSDGKTLVVYAASLDDPRGPDYVNQDKETIKITSLHDYPDDGAPTFAGVSVAMLGIRREYRNPSIERVIVDGHDYSGPMSVTFLGDGKEDTSATGDAPPTAQFDLDAIVFGGSGNDKIKTGIGNSWVDGGGGDDIIVTGDRTVLDPASEPPAYVRPGAMAVVAGGSGNDSITVGNGDDVVAGDSAIGYELTGSLSLRELKNDDRDGGDPIGSAGEAGASVTVPDWTTFTNPESGENHSTDGNDVLHVGLGPSHVYGNDGMDTLAVAPDSTDLAKLHQDQETLFESPGATLVGGTGDDSFAGGNGDDVIITGPDTGGLDIDPDANGGADDGHSNTVDTGTGNDTVYGSTGADFVIGHSQPDEIDNLRGGAGEDVLVGGTGEDTVFGGPDDDYVIAEASDVGPAGPDDGYGPSRTVTHRDLPADVDPAYKVLVGGTGDDHIIGGDGGAAIDGDGYNPTARCGPGSPVASDPVDESVNTASDGNDKIIGGAGVENVRAGGGNDDVSVKGAADLACGESGTDTLAGGADADQIWGGSGPDTIHGGAAADHLYGNDGTDTIYGDAGPDEIEGNDGIDWITGGAGADVIIGGTHAAEGDDRPDTTDFLFGDTGADTIIGDNATDNGPDNGDWYPLDLDGTAPSAGAGDFIWGASGADTIYGGLGGDVIFGGTEDDAIEGNNGVDTVHGQDGDDDIIGGSSEFAAGDTGLDAVGRPDDGDHLFGDGGQDVITGDNARLAEVSTGSGHLATQNRLNQERSVRLLDLGYTPIAGTSGGDEIEGGDDEDVVFGQAGIDTISGGDGYDYLEGGQDADTIDGNSGADDIVGGSSTIETGTVADQTAGGQFDSGDVIDGGDESDVVIGDNGIVHRATTPETVSPLTTNRGIPGRVIVLYDLGDTPPHTGTAGDDDVVGSSGVDVILGQAGNDRLKGNAADDYVEGGPGRDWVEGNDGDDDLVGGSSTIQGPDTGDTAAGQPDVGDAVWGGGGDDVITGDNAIVTRNTPYDELTNRIGHTGLIETRRSMRLLDLSNGGSILNAPAQPRFGGDQLSGGAHVDVILGQDGPDDISGGGGDDYAEGNGDVDHLWGDQSLSSAGIAISDPGWPGSASGEPDLNGPVESDGQDDLLGGSSRIGFRDAGDVIHGNGASDFELGDNGTVRRHPIAGESSLVDEPYALRYESVDGSSAAIRIPAAGEPSTRFCSAPGADTCEVSGAFGADQLFGDGGDDFMYGQDGNDQMWGGAQDDDMYGELGDDQLWGQDGNDAILGDRGGIVDRYEDGTREVSVSYSQVPKIDYSGFLAGSVTRIVDLQHDVIGDHFVDASGDPIDTQAVPPAKMPFDGIAYGGNDRIRGGNGHDSLHGGVGDDLVNGDSGGDIVFGDDGADVLWGGKGCDPAIDTLTVSPDCWTVESTFDPNARGIDDRMVDYVLGGKGATSGPSVDPDTGDLGADIIDWRPRGDSADCVDAAWPVTSGTKKNPVTNDPCAWFEMTDTDDGDVATNQHHQGIDWQYGGWDRDIMQGDVADNGPNEGDRLLDWNGAYNLYTHCNAAYGGYNDVRQHSPGMEEFLKTWTFTLGAGQVDSDVSDPTTSAYDELAFVYHTDSRDHGAGKAFPSTPGHFDDPNACAP